MLIDYVFHLHPRPEIYVASFANAKATARTLLSEGYSRIYLVCGIFFECLSIEDMVLGGQIIAQLGSAFDRLDDDAQAMLACFQAYGNKPSILEQSWVGKVLKHLDKTADIADALEGKRIPPDALALMRKLTLKVDYSFGIPMITNVNPPKNPPE